MPASPALRISGVVIIAVGVWVALVAYIGPLFGYPMPPGSDQPAWEWSASHTWRHLLPGLVAIAGGAMLLARGRPTQVIGGVLAGLAGIWMIISPFVVRAWLEGGGGGGGDASTLMQIITPLGYHHVPGILTVGLAAFALGRMVGARRTVQTPRDRADGRHEAPATRRRETAGV